MTMTIDCTEFKYIRQAEYDAYTRVLTVTIVCTPDDVVNSGYMHSNMPNVDDELLDVVNLIPSVLRTSL